MEMTLAHQKIKSRDYSLMKIEEKVEKLLKQIN